MSVILFGTIAVAVGYMLNIQAAYAVEVGAKQVQVQIPLLQIQVQGPGSDGGDKGSGGSSSGGSDSGDHGGSSSGGGDDKGGQGSGSNDERNRQDNNKDDNNNSGQGQYCYSVTVTNPLNGKTRTVDVCFNSRSDCEQAQSSDPDSEGGCESHS
ncbi:MAG: hypothetical protein ABI348_08325 [Nitrososphaera sp.]|jgi:hypothetical protein